MSWVGVALEQVSGSHDHAGGAEATLETMLLPETLLERMHLTLGGQAFDGCYFGTMALDGQDRARLDTLAVEVNYARATLAGITADVRSSQIELFAQVVNQQRPRLNIARVRFPIDSDGDRCHSLTSLLTVKGESWGLNQMERVSR